MSSTNTLEVDGLVVTSYTLMDTLTSTAGAGTLGLLDAGDYYVATTVEGALQEIASSWTGSTALEVLGTVQTGVWEATPVADAYVASAATWNAKVPPTRTINGYALSSNVTLTKADVGLGSVENTALSTWPGSTQITTLGSVTVGTLPAANVPVTDAGGYYTSSNVEDVLQEAAARTPAGSLIMYAGNAAPTGWLLCDGSAVSRTTYAALFAVVGTTYGVGNGSTTFNLPDLRGRFPLAAGAGTGLTNRVLGASGGAETVTLTSSEMPAHTHTGTSASNGAHTHTGTTDSGGSHTHSVTDPGHTHTQTTVNDDFNNSGANPPGFTADSAGSRTWSNINSSTTGVSVNSGGSHTHTFTTDSGGSHTHSFTSDSTGGGAAHENMPPFLAVTFLIKT